MISFRPLTASLLLAFAAALPAAAYTALGGEYRGQTVFASWPAGSLPLRFRVNDRPLSLLTNFASNSTPGTAIDGAIKSWFAGTGIGIRNDGTIATLNVGDDKVNLISFADTPQNRDFVANALGRASVAYSPVTGEIFETDIILDPRTKWATDGRAIGYDAEQVLAHEMGHTLGLAHSALLSSTMAPWSLEGSTQKRSLEKDDLAGAHFLYPSLAPLTTGVLTGRVTTTDNRPVLGAHVVALDFRGIATVAAASLADGSYRLTSLPTGEYQVYAEPLDEPVTLADLFNPIFSGGLSGFRTQFAGGNATPALHKVTAGQTTAVDPIKVEAKAPSFDPTAIGRVGPDGRASLSAGTQSVRAGSTGILAVSGKGLEAVPTEGIRVTGGDIVFDRSGVQRFTQNGRAYAFLPFHVAAGAAPGPRSLSFATTTERALLSGAIEVAP